jgi:hypothetical protein
MFPLTFDDASLLHKILLRRSGGAIGFSLPSSRRLSLCAGVDPATEGAIINQTRTLAVTRQLGASTRVASHPDQESEDPVVMALRFCSIRKMQYPAAAAAR